MSEGTRKPHRDESDYASESEFIPLIRSPESRGQESEEVDEDDHSPKGKVCVLRRSWINLVFDIFLALLFLLFLSKAHQ